MITVIVPNFNGYVSSCLDCLYKQDLLPSHVILIDDASKDFKSSDYKEYNNLEIIVNQKSIGLQNTKNLGLSKVTTKYVAICDSLCTFYKQKLSDSVELLEKYEDVSSVYSDFEFYDLKSFQSERIFFHPYDFNFLNQGINIPHNSVYRTEALQKIKGFKANDIESTIDLAKISMLLHIPKNLYLQRGIKNAN